MYMSMEYNPCTSNHTKYVLMYKDYIPCWCTFTMKIVFTDIFLLLSSSNNGSQMIISSSYTENICLIWVTYRVKCQKSKLWRKYENFILGDALCDEIHKNYWCTCVLNPSYNHFVKMNSNLAFVNIYSIFHISVHRRYLHNSWHNVYTLLVSFRIWICMMNVIVW